MSDDNKQEYKSKDTPAFTEMKSTPYVRSTFNKENAEKFRPIFDRLLETREPIILNAAKLGVNSRTLQNRMGEARRWLAMHATATPTSKFTKEDYAQLQAQTKICAKLDDVTVEFKKYNNLGDVLGATSTLIGGSLGTSDQFIKDLITTFLESSKQVLILEGKKNLGGRELSDELINWVSKTLGDVGIEFEVERELIRAVKPD